MFVDEIIILKWILDYICEWFLEQYWSGSRYGPVEDWCGARDEIEGFTSWTFLIVNNQISARRSLCATQIGRREVTECRSFSAYNYGEITRPLLDPWNGTVCERAQRKTASNKQCKEVQNRHFPAYSGGHTTYSNNCRIFILKKRAENDTEISVQYPEVYVRTEQYWLLEQVTDWSMEVRTAYPYLCLK